MRKDVDVEYLANILWGVFQERFARHDASIVDEQVNVAHFRCNLKKKKKDTSRSPIRKKSNSIKTKKKKNNYQITDELREIDQELTKFYFKIRRDHGKNFP